MRKFIAGFGLLLMILLGVATVASAAPVLPPDEYGPSVQVQAMSVTPTAPVLPPDEY
ncbi:MAG: hypothetical protein M0Z66_02765 [Thermaerobacter sp.]|nr:hypothetical protein [Thermaerobacter sp.]